jgi:type I restriction enzyme S subunit
MRILLGSIALVDDGDANGITSPDYVAVKGIPGKLDTRWFYWRFRSPLGMELIGSLSRGAVRERILFSRLSTGEIELPSADAQVSASRRMKAIITLKISMDRSVGGSRRQPATRIADSAI